MRARRAPAMRGEMLERFGLQSGAKVRVKQGGAEVVLEALRNDKIPAGCVRVPAAHPDTAALGAMFGPVTVERA